MTNDLKTLSKKAGDELQIHYVALSSLADKLLDGNSKKHDIDTQNPHKTPFGVQKIQAIALKSPPKTSKLRVSSQAPIRLTLNLSPSIC